MSASSEISLEPPTPTTNGKCEKASLEPPTPTTNDHGQANRLQCSCETPQRTFHISWITFWLCFFVWFCTTNLSNETATDTELNLSWTQHQIAGTLSITSTIFFRLIIADLCPKYGSRVTYVIVLISTALSLIGMALIQSVIGYMIFHVLLGIAGASFAVTQYHVTRMFSLQIAGLAQAMSAGFGNFGGGCANFIVPLLIHYFHISWRWLMAVFAAIVFLFSLIYYFATDDHPTVHTPDPPSGTNTELQGPIDVVNKGSAQKDEPPDKQINISFKDAFTDYRSWILFLCYAASFGVELTFYLFAAHYFQSEYDLNAIQSGFIIMLWSSMNLFARPLGSWFSDHITLVNRGGWLFVILFFESLFLMLFAVQQNLYGAIVVSLVCSVCVQMAQGIVFSIAPFVQPKSVGHVMAIVGSDGALGATFFSFVIFIPWSHMDFDQHYAWMIVGAIVLVIAFGALRITFTERELMETRQNEQACYELDRLQTVRGGSTKDYVQS